MLVHQRFIVQMARLCPALKRARGQPMRLDRPILPRTLSRLREFSLRQTGNRYMVQLDV
jgi:hypothetical protein